MSPLKIIILDTLAKGPNNLGNMTDGSIASVQKYRVAIEALEKKGYVVRYPNSAHERTTPMWLGYWLGLTFECALAPTTSDRVRAAGFTIPTTTIVLAADDEDVDQFTRLVTLLSIGISSGSISPSTDTLILDIDKVAHHLPASAVVTAILQYGVWLKTLWDNSY